MADKIFEVLLTVVCALAIGFAIGTNYQQPPSEQALAKEKISQHYQCVVHKGDTYVNKGFGLNGDLERP